MHSPREGADREPARDKIVLLGLEFYGHHGVQAEEKRLGARFVIDLEMYLSLEGIVDRIQDTADYGAVYDVVAKEVTGDRSYLIEALANRIAQAVLHAQPKVTLVVVRVHKPHAPIQGVFRDVFVEVRRSRSGAS